MRHTVLIATLSSVVASVLTTVVIGGSLFGAGAASSANTPVEAEGAISPGGVEGILQGDINCDGVVDAHDALGDLRFLGELDVQQTEPCPDIGTLAAIPGPAGPAGAPGPAGPQGPIGPQGPPGITEFASVATDGQLISGTAISADISQSEQYTVTFGRDLTGCVAVASQGWTAAGSGFDPSVRLRHVLVAPPASPTTVVVGFADVDTDMIEDTGFHLIVVC